MSWPWLESGHSDPRDITRGKHLCETSLHGPGSKKKKFFDGKDMYVNFYKVGRMQRRQRRSASRQTLRLCPSFPPYTNITHVIRNRHRETAFLKRSCSSRKLLCSAAKCLSELERTVAGTGGWRDCSFAFPVPLCVCICQMPPTFNMAGSLTNY